MLKLRRIEILGFKSFSDRSDITVHDNGVTAIVGPNGCGKSNVSDAIAWVLGEQSAKSLRGEKMEDVIFNGTRNRSPMGMAQVTITLTETDPPQHAPNGTVNGNGNGHAHGLYDLRRDLMIGKGFCRAAATRITQRLNSLFANQDASILAQADAIIGLPESKD